MTRLAAPAKLTWYLEVTGQRADGYHELRSEMRTLALADTLEISEGDAVEYRGEIDGVDRLNHESSTLVHRALALVNRRAHVTVNKCIPLGGGLGGGSADAAAILRWANYTDLEGASRLGGDVPFCLIGGRAVVTGIGEGIEVLRPEPTAVTLLLPPFPIDTTACYRAFDAMWAEGWRPHGRNHLEEPAVRVNPDLGAVLAAARAEFGDVTLAGSGSTLFIEGHHGLGSTWLTDVGELQVCETVTA